MLETIKYYNANTHNVSSGDCVKRGISLAFNLDYEYTAKLLRQKAKDLRINSWQLYPVFTSVIKDLCHGELTKINAVGDTVEQFSNNHEIGTYILLCQDRKESHLVTVIDGVIYDSWDSRHMIIYEVIQVSTDATKIYPATEQLQVLKDYAFKVLNDLITKFNFKYGYLTVDDSSDFLYDMEYGFSLTIKYNLTEIGVKSLDLYEIVDYTFSPRRSAEENKKAIFKLSKTIITKFAKSIKEHIDEYETDDTYDDMLEGDYANIIYKLPLWSQKLLIKSYRIFSWNHGQKIYDLEFQPMHGDPNRDNLILQEPTLSEIKKQLEQYKKTFERPGLDY